MRNNATLIILCSFLCAILLAVLPLPHWGLWWRPAWIALVLLYWSIVLPEGFTIGAAFFMGCYLDLLMGSVFGVHAFACVLIVFLGTRFHTILRALPMLQQMVCVGVIVWVYQICLWLPEEFMRHHGASLGLFSLASLTSVLVWPWVFLVLRECTPIPSPHWGEG